VEQKHRKLETQKYLDLDCGFDRISIRGIEMLISSYLNYLQTSHAEARKLRKQLKKARKQRRRARRDYRNARQAYLAVTRHTRAEIAGLQAQVSELERYRQGFNNGVDEVLLVRRAARMMLRFFMEALGDNTGGALRYGIPVSKLEKFVQETSPEADRIWGAFLEAARDMHDSPGEISPPPPQESPQENAG
jgi:hypothetical protein